MNEEREAEFVLVGNVGVGKSSIFKRFVENKFTSNYTHSKKFTEGSKEISVKGQPTRVLCSDSGGPERVIELDLMLSDQNEDRPLAGFVVVLNGSIDPEQQKKAMTKWTDLVRPGSDLPIYFLVNKKDSPDFKGEPLFRKAVDKWKSAEPNPARKEQNKKISVFFCSAETGCGVNEAFQAMAESCPVKRIRLSTTTERVSKKDSSPLAPVELKNRVNVFSEHKVWVGGNVVLAVAAIVFLVLAASFPPVTIALGLGISALAGAAIISAAALLLWNAGCAIKKVISESSHTESASTIVDNPILNNSTSIPVDSPTIANAAVVHPSPVGSKIPHVSGLSEERKQEASINKLNSD